MAVIVHQKMVIRRLYWRETSRINTQLRCVALETKGILEGCSETDPIVLTSYVGIMGLGFS